MEHKKILMLNGSYNEIPLIEAAHRLGFYVITSGNDPKAEGHKHADEYCPCDYSNCEAIYELAKEKEVDAICSCGNDLGAISASFAAEKLNLPGHDTLANTLVFHEKDQFKKLIEELDLPSPRAHVFTDEAAAIEHMKTAKYPRIVKPVDLGGGKGIQVVENFQDGVRAIKNAFRASFNKHIVIERYVRGKQMGYTCFIKDKKVVFSYLTEDFSYLNPYMVWMAVKCPEDEYLEMRNSITKDVEKIAEYKNIADGFLTIQVMISGKQYYFIETMRRCLGNFHYLVMSKDTGINFYDLFIANEAGLDTTELLKKYAPKKSLSGFMGIYGYRNGTYDSVSYDFGFKRRIWGRKMLVTRGYEIDNYLYDKLGMVFFTFKNRKQKKKFLDERMNLFKVNYK